MLLRLEDVSKVYKMGFNRIPALDTIDLTVERGEFVGIMGPSGSGKSTLMHIIGGLDKPTSGRYFIDGHDVNSLTDRHLARVRNKEFGFIFQTFNLLSRMTVLKNVELPLIYAGFPRGKKRMEKAFSSLRFVDLEDRIDHKPNELSGGQQQRVAIARALVTDPSILLADEPTGNLDSTISKDIMNFFLNLNKHGKTIILVTHDESLAGYMHRIVHLKDGKIVGNGS